MNNFKLLFYLLFYSKYETKKNKSKVELFFGRYLKIRCELDDFQCAYSYDM